MISSVTRVSGWTGPGGGRRPRGRRVLVATARAPRLLGGGEGGDERAPRRGAGRFPALHPRRAAPPLLLLAPRVGEGARAEPRPRGGGVELAPPAEIPLRLL